MSRILMIEDEEPIREEVLDWLQFEGYQTLGAGNGREGVETAVNQTPDLILCDITMPEMDGYEVLLELRKQPTTTRIPLIFLSARADKSFVRHGMELGADDYLTKPFTRSELLAAIRTRLERHSSLEAMYTKEIEESKLNLTRLVAHELKTPITSLRFLREIIDRQISTWSPAEIKDWLDSFNNSTNRLNHLVEQTVYITEIENGFLSWEKIQENGSPLQMWQIMGASIDLARHFAYRNREGQILTDERDHAATGFGQTPYLKHAFAELIANALNFSPENTPVTISQWEADGSIWISIFDSGIGVSAANLTQMSQPFHQINREQREQQGLGLGLFVARSIFEAHQGTLDIGSVEHKGTQVMVSLPVFENAE